MKPLPITYIGNKPIYQHFDGYYKSRQDVLDMNESELLNLIDALWGRDNLEYGASIDDLRQEALRQHEIEWRM